MKYTFWGVRGSHPVSDNKFNSFGGHTSCSSLFLSNEKHILLDAGTGIIKFGENLVKKNASEGYSLHLLLTHFHLDHIIGLPFFGPLYSSKCTITFYSTIEPARVEKILSGFMGGNYFPVHFKKTEAKKVFKRIPPDGLTIEDVKIETHALRHPQGALAYRLIQKGESVVLATDTEHPAKGVDDGLVKFAANADYLIYDAMFTPEEYERGKKNWGHSTWKAGISLASEAKVSKLFLSHFNPKHSDNQINRFLAEAKTEFPKTYGAKGERSFNQC